MSERKRIFYLISLMIVISLVAVGITMHLLYQTAFMEEQERLVETAQSHARLIEAVARFDAIYSTDYPGGATLATISQIIDAHDHYKGFGKTGEFTIAKREGDQIIFILRHRHYDLDQPKPVLFDSELAEPMQRALSGLSGTVVGLDYRGEKVLAAHEPVAVLDLGIVAKIDLAEIRAPFLRAGVMVAGSTLLVILVGVILFSRISNPMIDQLREKEERYRSLFSSGDDAKFVSELRTGKFIEVNDMACQRLGYTREELLKLSVMDIAVPEESPDSPYFNKKVMEKLLTEKQAMFEASHTTKSGKRIPVEINSHIFDLKETSVIVSIARDVTERKLVEEALQKAHDELEERVKERTSNLSETNKKLRIEITERKQAEEQLQRNYDTQAVINTLLSFSLEDTTLKEILKQSLDHILSIPWLAFESKGCLFLVEDDSKTLVMKVQSGLEKPLYKECKKIPFGKCLCGRAALTRQIQFAESIDERHEIHYEGMTPHGHYCVPIMYGEELLGILNVYLRAGYQRDQKDEDFLTVVSKTLAGIIVHIRTETALQQSQQDYRSLVNDIEGIVWEADAKTFRFLFVSRQAKAILGYPVSQWLEEPAFWSEHIHPDDREWSVAFCTKATAEQRGHEFEYRMIAADGHPVWMRDIVTVVVENDQPVKLRGVMVDITELKRAEQDLEASRDQLRKFSAHLQTVREEERTTIAREVHDELGQTLTALEMDIAWLAKKLPEDQRQLTEKTKSMLQLTDTIINSVQRISSELRPVLLDDLGLIPAVKWQANDFEKRTGIKTEILSIPEEIILDRDRSTAIFRILQETLTNVARHAEATKVKVSLEVENDRLILNIIDNGKGITGEQISNTDSLGIIGMRERVFPYNGGFEIKGQKGKGTIVRVCVPLG